MLILDYFRGTDSTGLASIDKDGSASIVKAAVDPITLFQMKSFDKALSGYGSYAFIGHNRAATLGLVNSVNAHPFQYGDITGAHNGTLNAETWKRLEKEAGIETDVDSAAIFACINEIGISDTVKLMEKGRTPSTGAWALVWYDKKDDTINFLRNSYRPLWYGFNEACDKIVWASEWPMMNGAEQLTEGWGNWYSDKDGFSFFPFEEDHHYSFSLGDIVSGLSHTDIKNFKGEKMEGREPAPFVPATTKVSSGMGGSPWKKNDKETTIKSYSKASFDYVQEKTDENVFGFTGRGTFPSVETVARSDVDPLGGYITEQQFNDMARHGCSWCGAGLDINDPGMTIYADDDVILCQKCSSREDDNLKLYLPPTSGRVVNAH